MKFAILQMDCVSKKKGIVMSKFYFLFFVFTFVVANAEEGVPTLADNTKSVLAEPATSFEAQKQISSTLVVESAPVCKGPNCVKYKNKGSIAPCAVPTQVGVCMTETGCDACCQKVTTRTPVSVEICAPACPAKEDVRTYRNGSRVVYDYGRYEAVVTGKDGVVEVRYRKKLFNR